MMLNFNMNVDNFFLASIIDAEEFENELNELLSRDYIYKQDIDNFLESHGISFWDLPQYFQEKIDSVDIICD